MIFFLIIPFQNADLFFLFFSHQKMRIWYLDSSKKEGENFLRVLVGDAKNEISGPTAPPPLCT